jgi:pimeloyl-ACP methyl ester carboxylesterase
MKFALRPTETYIHEVYDFATERGRRGLTANRRDIARVIWTRNSPTGGSTTRRLDRAARAVDNPDYIEVVIHSYRHRLGLAPSYLPNDQLEQRLAAQPPITVPTVTLDGLADGTSPATDGSSSARHVTGPRVHHPQVPDAGHNLPQEAPEALAGAILELADLRSRSSC